MRVRVVVLGAILVLVAPLAVSTEAQYRGGSTTAAVAASHDTMISQHAVLGGPDFISGSLGTMHAIRGSGNYLTYPLVKFDLTDYAGSVATGPASFELSLVGNSFFGQSSRRVTIHEILIPWDSETATYNNFGDEPGVQFGVDVGPAIDEEYIAYPTPGNRIVSWDIPTFVVQGWIDDPSSNHGILVYNQELLNRRDLIFDSLEGNTAPNLLLTSAPADQERLGICHRDDSGRFRLVEVPARAYVRGHIGHGDGLPGQDVPNMLGYVFDDSCILRADELVFALAYTDVDPTDGGFNAGADVLIAKLIDGPGAAADGIPGAGDVVVTNQYPKDFGARSFGDFFISHHFIDGLHASTGPEICAATNDSAWFGWRVGDLAEFYREFDRSDLNKRTSIEDAFDVLTRNRLQATVLSPSRPEESIWPELVAFGTADDAFVDVEHNCIR